MNLIEFDTAIELIMSWILNSGNDQTKLNAWIENELNVLAADSIRFNWTNELFYWFNHEQLKNILSLHLKFLSLRRVGSGQVSCSNPLPFNKNSLPSAIAIVNLDLKLIIKLGTSDRLIVLIMTIPILNYSSDLNWIELNRIHPDRTMKIKQFLFLFLFQSQFHWIRYFKFQIISFHYGNNYW